MTVTGTIMSREKENLSPNDPSSFSRPELVKITHIHLILDVNFSTRVLKGSAVLQLEKCVPSETSIILDTRDLTIHNVEDENGKDLKFKLGDPVLSFGSKLDIQLPDSASEKYTIKVNYETSPSCTALQWLLPQQTAGKKQPYLFSQCQAIHARSLLPCQDTPAVKMPYSAEISTPADLKALMSAVGQQTKDHQTDSGKKVHIFEQKVPIPSYLIAIVVGALESRDIGPRSKVWSEKEMVDAAAYEFAETEQMLATAESLLGPYVWGVYDLLVLPPSFPYGGMENPCLTFVTPTLLAGDRSLADVVAHEIAHSWTGNLVTNSNPEHFWLNEGHTEFVERMVVSRVRAIDNTEPFRHFLAIDGLRALSYQIGWKIAFYLVEEVFGKNHPFTHLVPDLKGVDPDDAFSSVPYEKGSNLLMYLEQKLGGPEAFEPFLRAYIEKFKYKSITTWDWKAFLYDFFQDKKALLDEVDWEAWFHKPGMPPVKPKYDTTLSDACATLAKKWSSASDSDLTSFTADDLKPLSTYQVKEFLAQLLEEPPLSGAKLDKMEELYKLNVVRNSEIRFRWLRLNLRGKVESAVSGALDFVTEQGRMKFVRPIYRDLFLWEQARPKAVVNYDKYKGEMHTLTATMVGKDLQAAQLGKA